MDINEKRNPKRENFQMVPQPVKDDPGMVTVDTTWGKIQPINIADGVSTVDEMQVYEYQQNGLQLIDARKTHFYEESTIPGSTNIPHTEVVERMEELDRSQPAIFFCNGPQCPQSPTAIKNLLENGYPADKILYYRGGMHDWVTMGLPVKRPEH